MEATLGGAGAAESTSGDDCRDAEPERLRISLVDVGLMRGERVSGDGGGEGCTGATGGRTVGIKSR